MDYDDCTIWSEESGALLDRMHQRYLDNLERKQNADNTNHLPCDPAESATPRV